MKNFISKFGLAIAATAIIFTGCNDDDPAVVPTFNPEVVTVQAGDPVEATITAGTAPFSVQSAATGTATATVDGNTITITGVAAGSTVIRVSGSDGGTANLAVVVTARQANAPNLSASVVEIHEATLTANVTISGGTPGFTAVSAHPNIASVSVSGTTVTVRGESMGTTLVTVRGSDNASATFAVNVGGEQLFFGPNRDQIGSGAKTFYISKNHTIREGVYTMVGWIHVEDGAELTIEPGTVIKGSNTDFNGNERATGSSLIVMRGGKIWADGTREKPIVFTSAQPVGQRQASDWGGIIICGRARNNTGEMLIEGGVDALHGGDDDDDNSGILRFVRIEFGGYPYSLDNEINGLTMGSVGRGTTIEYIQVSYCGDDSFEWFGGTVNHRYLVSYHAWDDDFDPDQGGYSGMVQFGLIVRDPRIADQSNSNAFESDNHAQGLTLTPITRPIFSNVTVIGPIGQDPAFPIDLTRTSQLEYITGYDWGATGISAFPISRGIFQAAVHIRRHSHMSLFNSVLTGFPVGLIVDNMAGGSNSQGAAQNGDLQVKNVFFAGMGQTGATINNNQGVWTDGAHANDVPGFTSEGYFLREGGNNRVFDNIDDLMLKQFQSKVLPIPQRGASQNRADANWGPMSGSPLLGAADFSDAKLNNPYFTPTTYVGAFASDATNWPENWLDGWTNFDPQNTVY